MPNRARCACTVGVLLAGGLLSHGQSDVPLRLERAVPLPDVKGRIDHLAFDTDNERLFVAALGNNTVEVIDIKSGRVVREVAGLAEPQGVLYQSKTKRLWIANGSDGKIQIFNALTFEMLRSIELGEDADNIRQDAATQRILVGYGSGAIAVLDFEGNKVGDIKVGAHPESFQLEKNGPRMFVNLPDSRNVTVIDRTKSAVVASWTTDDAQANFPMALDEVNGRLFIVCRQPAVLLVLDTKAGAIVAKLPVVGDSDDVFYDQKRQQVYASGGDGSITVFKQQDADHYSKITQLKTVKGARTCLFVPELSRLFLAVRQEGDNTAAINIYKVTD